MILALVAAALAEPRLVVAPSGLRLREAPDSEAPIVVKLPYGARVEVLARGARAEEGGELGYWVEVTGSGARGYLFDRWLSQLPAPPEGCEGLADWADAALGPPVTVRVSIDDDCDCPARQLRTARDYGEAGQYTLIEGFARRREVLTLTGAAIGLSEAWAVAGACLRQDGEPVAPRFPQARAAPLVWSAGGLSLSVSAGDEVILTISREE